MGEKIYTLKCQSIDVALYESYESLNKNIEEKNLCSKLSTSHLEAVALYLWDTKRHLHKEKKYPKLKVTQKEKCPICGMFLYKYPRWVSKIEYQTQQFGFDGVKDLMKYYFEHQEGIKQILVQDYYTQETLEARSAFFVLGSDVYGPMGNELIAFKDEKHAQQFLRDHKGKEILRFDAITPQKVYALDE